MIINKFGGTSVTDFECMLRCADAVQKTTIPNIAVVSATAKTTRQLLALSKPDLTNQERNNILKDIQEQHYAIFNQLNNPQHIKSELNELFKKAGQLSISLKNRADARLTDKLLAIGELLSSLLFVEILKIKNIAADYFDARKIIKTDSSFGKAEPNIEKIKEYADKHLLPLCNNRIIVTQGFIGSDENNNTTTLGFESSDYTASLIAEALNAEQINIWTDVPGIQTTDPKLTSQTKTIEEISFHEMNELATFGAKVLHPATLWPAIRKNINVLVHSGTNPKHGTRITRDISKQPTLRAITLKKNQVLLTITSHNLFHSHGLFAKIFNVLDTNKIDLNVVTTNAINMATLLNEDQITPQLLDQLKQFAQVKIEKDFALITLVGNHLHTTPGIGKKILDTVGENNIRLFAHGASSHNICFAVANNVAKAMIAKLHQCFFE